MEVIAVILSVLSVIGYIEARVKKELKPNGGSSLKDQLNRLEDRVNELYSHLINKNWHRKQHVVLLVYITRKDVYGLFWILKSNSLFKLIYQG